MSDTNAEPRQEIIFPAQCVCGHLFMERYQFQQPTPDGVIAFCWCGFCRKRYNIMAKGYADEQ